MISDFGFWFLSVLKGGFWEQQTWFEITDGTVF
jgi:hypothetical protein